MKSRQPSLIRLLEYKNILRKLKSLSFNRVFSSNLADILDVSSSLVRKDFLTLATSGNKKGGYNIDALLGEINRKLHKDKLNKAVVIGMGKIGSALVNYSGFNEENIEFTAGFDLNPDVLARSFPIPVYPVEKLTEILVQNQIHVGVLCVPAAVVQRIADLMVISGVKGFLNFAPIRLLLPEDCYENHINLALELEKTILYVENNLHSGTKHV